MPGTEDRVRAILGIAQGSSLPKVSSAALLGYYRYLSSRLVLPCEAQFSVDDGTVYPVTVLRLADPQTMPSDSRAGLCCVVQLRDTAEIIPLAEIEMGCDSPNFQILEDYWFWFWNWRECRSYPPSKPR
jgi:hypothetical protein